MATVEGLNRRGARYYLLVVIPKDLQPSYEGTPKKNISLGTSDKAEAVRKGLHLRAQWMDEFEAKRKALNPQKLENITPELAQALAEAGRRGVLKRDQDMRDGKDGAFKALRKGIREAEERLPRIRIPNSGWPTSEELPELIPLGGISEWEAGVVSEINTSRLEEARKNIARGNLLYFLPLLQWDAQAMGFTVTLETEGLKEALQAYTKSYLRALQDVTQKDSGELISIDSHLPITSVPKAATRLSTEAPTVAVTAGAAAGASEEQTLRDIHALWLKASPKTHDTAQASSRALNLAEECLGIPLYIQQVTRAQGNTFKAWLQEPARGFSPKTAKNQLMYVNSLLRFACVELEAIQRNPWHGLAIEVPKTVTRRPWKDEELHQLFKQPLFQAYEVPPEDRSGGGPAAYWLPIIGIYTGARIGELAQLRVSDITEEDGIPVIRITDEGEDQKVKTNASRRYIPIHSELIRLGLLEYAEEIRKASQESLWPHLRNPNVMSAWFGRYRKSVGLDDKWLDFHSFRHTVRTRLAKAQVQEKIQDAITGHETGGSTGRKVYTHLDMHDLKEAIEKLSYGTPLELPKVLVQKSAN
ncbi:MAG: site-specific integrase [Comamonas sp.]|nr:site-specific integrase [Comamonas sp.]